MRKDQDPCGLKNWRPISLLNVDAKIVSNVIAERLKRILPDLRNENQSGYIPDRNICDNIRAIIDLIEYRKTQKWTWNFIFIYFERAFDSLDWDFLNKCKELFNFGPDFIKWVNLFYKNIQSCVINNGRCSHSNTLLESVNLDKETLSLSLPVFNSSWNFGNCCKKQRQQYQRDWN